MINNWFNVEQLNSNRLKDGFKTVKDGAKQLKSGLKRRGTLKDGSVTMGHESESGDLKTVTKR